MAQQSIQVEIDTELLEAVNVWVAVGVYRGRDEAVADGLRRVQNELKERQPLLRALARVDPAEERALAEERYQADVPWPEYG